MKRVFTMVGNFEERNLTIWDIRALKGQQILTQTLPSCPEDASAATKAGIDLLNVRFEPEFPHRAAAIRAASPQSFITFAMPVIGVSSSQEALRMAHSAIQLGADSIMCQWSLEFVETLSKAGIPVQGHVGLVPRKSMWTGGLRAVGKTTGEAMSIYQDIKDLENAGAWAVECEVMPSRVTEELSKRTSLITVSIGAGSAGDVQFLFARDILGDGPGPFPRHSKQYCDLEYVRASMQDMRKTAFSAFIADVHSGSFPASQHEVKIDDEAYQSLVTELDKVQKI
jgi:3-methyl-2-oxobutanoate hydroxymethyltransferase